jgi:rubrerythrin
MTTAPNIPELAGVRVAGMTRSAFMMRGALAAASAYGLGAVGPFVQRAIAQEVASGGDVGIVRFALTLEMLEATFYKEALKQVPKLSSEVKQVAVEIRDNEAEHVDLLTSLLNQLGASVGAAPKFDYGDAFASEDKFLELSQTFEDTGVQAYNGAAPQIESPQVLEAAGMIVQVEARHAGVIRLLRDEPITPGAFDRGASQASVEAKIKPYTA